MTTNKKPEHSWPLWLDILVALVAVTGLVAPGVLNNFAPRMGYQRFEWPIIADISVKVAGVIGFFYVYLKHGKKKHQTEEDYLKLQYDTTVNRHELALSVEMQTEVIPHDRGRFVKPTIIVHNVSANNFRVPAVYVTVLRAPASGMPSHESWSESRPYVPHSVHNVANYGNMVEVHPQEKESFTAWLYFDEDDIARYPTVVIQVDVVGAKELGPFGTNEGCDRFVAWMVDNGGHDKIVFESWSPKDKQELKDAHNKKRKAKIVAEPEPPVELEPSSVSLKRCLFSKPAGQAKYKRDDAASMAWKSALDHTMMWDRFAIVSLPDALVLASGKSSFVPPSPDGEASDDPATRLVTRRGVVG